MECCRDCKYFRSLKHNFQQHKGFKESYCCTVWVDDPDGWFQEVYPKDMCEMFIEKGEEDAGRND